MSDARWTVTLTPRADKEVGRLDPPVRRRVLTALDRLASEDLSVDVLRLTGSDQLRLRVGDWRVLFRRRPHARQIVVEHVLPRGRAYDR